MIFFKILPIMFLSILAIFGITLIGALFHEWIHTQDFETESLCFDYTNNSFMYVSSIYTSLGNYTDIDDRSFSVSRHFEIYTYEGMIMGALFILLLISSFKSTKELVKKQ